MELKSCLILLLLFFMTVGCGAIDLFFPHGPPKPKSEPEPPPTIPIIYGDKLAFKMGNKLASCFTELNATQSAAVIMWMPNVTTELKIYNKFATLNDLYAAEPSGGVVLVNAERAESCLLAIGNLACSDALVQQSYDAAKPMPLIDAYYLIRASTDCQLIYQ